MNTAIFVARQRLNGWMIHPLSIIHSIKKGGLAQLVRALALQARGHRFESDILHLFIMLSHQKENPS